MSEEQRWLPIESAPKYRSIRISNGDYVLRARLEPVDQCEQSNQPLYGWVVEGLPISEDFPEPTHWQEIVKASAPPTMPADDAFREVLALVVEELKTREGTRGNAPGHGHSEPGVWDWDNGARAGQPCAWCALWHRAQALLEGAGVHGDELALDRFAAAMRQKLAAAREKGRHGWDDPDTCSADELLALLREHLTKANPGNWVDIANFCMMLHERGLAPVAVINDGTASQTKPRG